MVAAPTHPSPSQKKAYQPPQLKTHGDLRRLTQAGSGEKPETGSRKQRDKRA